MQKCTYPSFSGSSITESCDKTNPARKCCSLKGTDSSNMLAIFWSWTCVENPELWEGERKKKTRMNMPKNNNNNTHNSLFHCKNACQVDEKYCLLCKCECLQLCWPARLPRTQRVTARQAAWADCKAGSAWRSVRGCWWSARSPVSGTPELGSAGRRSWWKPRGEKSAHTRRCFAVFVLQVLRLSLTTSIIMTRFAIVVMLSSRKQNPLLML